MFFLMIRRPPRSTRTDTLFPYTTPFRSVLTTMNGRDIFTAGGGRGFNLQDFPSELLGGIDVYTTPTADLIEGGIGGVIALRTRTPLDFDGFELSGRVRGRYDTPSAKIHPQVSALVTALWKDGGGGLE